MTGSNITTIMPFLTVSHGIKAVNFYMAAFGAVEKARYDMPGGKLTAEMGIGDAVFWVGDEEPQFGNLAPAAEAGSPVRIVLKTKHADELFEKALQYGATAICPMTTETVWRIGKLKDPFGHIWEIGYTL